MYHDTFRVTKCNAVACFPYDLKKCEKGTIIKFDL